MKSKKESKSHKTETETNLWQDWMCAMDAFPQEVVKRFKRKCRVGPERTKSTHTESQMAKTMHNKSRPPQAINLLERWKKHKYERFGDLEGILGNTTAEKDGQHHEIFKLSSRQQILQYHWSNVKEEIAEFCSYDISVVFVFIPKKATKLAHPSISRIRKMDEAGGW